MDADLSLEFLRVVEEAAIACAHTMGQGDRHGSDQVAVEAMRRVMDTVPIDGTIVIGEGERDEAPMLYIGEKVGQAHAMRAGSNSGFPQVDIAVDPLEGTNLCATGAANAIAVLAASSRGGLLHAPDLYMEKLVVGPSSKDAVSLDAPVHENLKAIARSLGRGVEDLVVIVLDRQRHEKLIADIRATGARIRLIGDGDLSAGIAAAVVGSGVHAVMGTGGAPEGVLTAAAMRCLNGEIFARLVVTKPEHEERCRAMGITDFKKVYRVEGSRARRARDFRGNRRHRRHADARRALLRRRRPHELVDHAERAASDPVHRQHSRRAVQGRQDTLLTVSLRRRFLVRPSASSRASRQFGTWRRNLFAVTAASFMGFTGFTLVMPFLPLFIRQLGVTDVGAIALWTGVSLGVTPALNALVSPFWGRLADRFGRKIMMGRSLTACVVVMTAMAFVTRAWHVFALRAVLGLLTGYGGLSLTMAAESAPASEMPKAIGTVQTAQRLGPAVGPSSAERWRASSASGGRFS